MNILNSCFKDNPKIIHQTWDSWNTIPPCCYEVIDRNRVQNSEWDYCFYDLKLRRKIITEHFDDAIIQAYDKLPTSTMQTDLFRLCCVYVHGGLYMDIKTKCGALSSLNLGGKLLYCVWPRLGPKDHPKHAATSILLWPKHHPVLKSVIDTVTRIIHSCETKNFKLDLNKSKITWITGPNVYAEVVCKKVPEEHMFITRNYLNGFFKHDGTDGGYYRYMKSRGLHWSQQKN